MCTPKHIHYYLIGIGNHAKPILSDHVRTLINASTFFSGGQRHYQLVKSILPKKHTWIMISGKMEEIINQYQQANQSVLIFTSGDPFFYGFGNTLKRFLPRAKITAFPYFNSIQRLCHKTQTNYNTLKAVSVHGRDWSSLNTEMINNTPLIGVLTDSLKNPNTIAKHLLQYGFHNYNMVIGEELDGVKEKISNCTLQAVSKHQFSALNCILLKQTVKQNIPFGIPDHQFVPLTNRPNMITKMPIRLSTLHALNLKNATTFWDIGSCTGSVAIETKRHFPHVNVIVFEKRAECKAIIQQNSERFSAPGIEIIMGDFFNQNLTKYPLPDVVFIGGHGNQLAQMITTITNINPKCKIVINAVKQTTITTFKATLKKLNYTVNSIQIQVDHHNPIQILSAVKKK